MVNVQLQWLHYISRKRRICVAGTLMCVWAYVHVSSVNNSFTSVVVPVERSCTGRRPSQVIAALTGHSRHTPATLQMCVFSALRGETWQGSCSSSDRDNTPRERPQSKLDLKSRESHWIKWFMNWYCCISSLWHVYVEISLTWQQHTNLSLG